MSFQELRELLIQVVTSWQVIAITVVVILYFSLVSYVAKLHHRHRHPSSTPKAKKEKRKKASPGNEAPITTDSDDLGLEEG